MFCGIVFKEPIYSLKLSGFLQTFSKIMEKHVVTKSAKIFIAQFKEKQKKWFDKKQCLKNIRFF